DELWKVDTNPLAIRSEQKAGGDIRGITSQGAGIWYSSLIEEKVSKINRSNLISLGSVDLNFTPGGINDRLQDVTINNNNLWAAIGHVPKNLVRIDPLDQEIEQTIGLPHIPVSVTAAGTTTWVIMSGSVHLKGITTDQLTDQSNDTSLIHHPGVTTQQTIMDTGHTVTSPTSTRNQYKLLSFENVPSTSVYSGPVNDHSNLSGNNATSTFSTPLTLSGRDTLTIHVWTNEPSFQVMIGKRSDTRSIAAEHMPVGLGTGDRSRRALGRTGILVEFAGENGRLLGDSVSTTDIGDSFSYSLTYNLSAETSRLFDKLDTHSSTNSNPFSFYYADHFTDEWRRNDSVDMQVTEKPSGRTIVRIAGLTHDL
ncbi:MAG: hypothetical protein ABEJ65_07660, partial [bacterium]